MKPLLVVAGAGSTGRLLIERLLSRWRVVVIEPDQAALDRLGPLEDPGLRTLCGDASSALVLNEAGLKEAFGIVAVTGRDDVNLEVCRLAGERFSIRNRFSVVHQTARVEEFEREGIVTVSRPHGIALALESRLVSGKRAPSDVGIGRGEIYEVTILPQSPVVGRSLSSLRPVSWLVAAIYRDSQMVVPHGNTVIEANDRVLLVGDPAVLPSIADYMHAGTAQFPLQFGSRIVVLGNERSCLDEARYLQEQSGALGLRVLLGPGHPALPEEESVALGEAWESRLAEILDMHDSGVLVMAPPPIGWRDRVGWGNRRFLQLLERTREPVLIARGSYPFKKLLLAVTQGEGSRMAAELALSMARSLGARLTAVVALPPVIVSGEDDNKRLRQKLDQTAGLGPMYGLAVTTEELNGNPVHALLEKAREFDLLVVAHRVGRSFSLTHPDVSRHLLLRAPKSVMVLPYGR